MQCLRRRNVFQGLPSPVLGKHRRPLRHQHLNRGWFYTPQTRRLSLDALTSVLIPPAVFGGLLVTLWTYKCLMMIVFQNRIIYMPSVPPFSRSEQIADYANQCRPVQWAEHSLQSVDGTALKLIEGRLNAESSSGRQKRLVILYFQGNASSLPPRLPYLSSILKTLQAQEQTHPRQVSILALSYRGFWTSKGKPSQAGIELDAEAALDWVLQRYEAKDTKVVLWGQSIGAGVASLAAARLLRKDPSKFKLVQGLLLETPFVGLRAMLVALYPQKWLPYRYLAPFLWSTWDSRKALGEIGAGDVNMRVMLLQAGDDEIVPDGQAAVLKSICRKHSMEVELEVIPGALHTEVMLKGRGRHHIVRFLTTMV